MLAFAMKAVVRQRANSLTSPKKWRRSQAQALVPWFVQEIRRVAIRRHERRSEPSFVIAWPAWRRAHQAVAQASPRRRKMQLKCLPMSAPSHLRIELTVSYAQDKLL